MKAVIFDCFGVLTTDTWRAFVDSLPPEADVQRARELNRQYGKGLLTHDQFLGRVFEATGHSPQEVDKLLDNEVTKNTALLAYIKELRQRSLKIGLLSNVASNWITSSFLTVEEQALFDDMVFSYKVGMAKPEQLVFSLSCERLGVQPAEAIFIDDIASYCEAAEQLGLKAIVYQDFDQFKAELELLLSQE